MSQYMQYSGCGKQNWNNFDENVARPMLDNLIWFGDRRSSSVVVVLLICCCIVVVLLCEYNCWFLLTWQQMLANEQLICWFYKKVSFLTFSFLSYFFHKNFGPSFVSSIFGNFLWLQLLFMNHPKWFKSIISVFSTFVWRYSHLISRHLNNK